MTRQHFARMKTQPIYAPAVAFINALRPYGIPLSRFTTSDWHSSTESVYIDTPYPRHRQRRCRRLDSYGIRYALHWYLHKKK